MTSYIDGIRPGTVYTPTRHTPIASKRVVDVSSKEVPEPWASRMVSKGFTDRRSDADVPSMRRLAESLDIHTSTISAAIHGTRTPSAGTIVALAEALGPDAAEWLGARYRGAWSPPSASALLTDRQRKAIEELINSMTEREKEVGNDAGGAAPNKQAPVSGAHVRDLNPKPPTAAEIAGEGDNVDDLAADEEDDDA